MKLEQLYESLLEEAFAESYLFTVGVKSNMSERYYFDAGPYEMEVYVSGLDGPIPVVGFYPSGTYNNDATSAFAGAGINPVKVFSTVFAILRQSALIKKSGNVFDMEINKSEKSRVSLYTRMASRYAKKFEDLGVDKGYHTVRVWF
jgi:hypothetical protein